ncbi:MAG: acyl-CoA thioesterase [Thermoguttaceae bacterium]|jgi:acyl-CoA thioester hydrolase
MPEIYEHHHTIRNDEVDSLGHANNVCYVGWLQDAAVAHSTAQGWSGSRYREMGCGWVVRSHKIDYLQSAYEGDAIVVRTWVATMNKATSLRRYQIVRAADQTLLATAETLWAFVNYATGRPTRILREIATAYQTLEQGAGKE